MVLDNRIAEELKKLHKSLEDQGGLLSREQLADYYSTFRSRFGPDKLKNLDGEALLNIMHDIGNRDSLVYWLEFKDDDEFPSMRFGSISGGSSFKFGLFRRKETGKWTTGSHQNPKELSIVTNSSRASDFWKKCLQMAPKKTISNCSKRWIAWYRILVIHHGGTNILVSCFLKNWRASTITIISIFT